MDFGQTVQVMVSWLVVALVVTVNSNPVNSIMTNCNCGSGDTSLEVQMDMIRNLNRSAQDALNFYLDSGLVSKKIFRTYVNNNRVTLRLPEAGPDTDLGAMQDTNIDCLTKVMLMVMSIRNNTNVSSIRNQQGLQQRLQTIVSRTCDAYCRLTGSRTWSSPRPAQCLLSWEQCGSHCTSIIRLRDIRNMATDMVQRYESLAPSHS